MLIRSSIAALLAAASVVRAEPDPAAKAKLQAAADAIKAAKSLSYKAIAKGEGGMLAGFSPKGDTRVLLERNPSDARLWMFRIEGTSTPAFGNEPPTHFLVVGDGNKKAWKDEPQKTVMERFNGAAGGPQVDLAMNGCAAEILDVEPLAKDLAFATITLDEAADVDGVKCDVVKTDDGRQRPHRFFIAQSDHLPRRIEHRIEGGGMNDAQVWILTEMKVDGAVQVPAGSFAISTPDGWTYSPATPPIAAAPEGGAPVKGIPAPGLRPRAVGVNPEDLAPDFELASGTGEKVKLSSLRDNVVVLDFWGTWCLPCKKASPEVQKLSEDYKSKPVKVFGLAVRDPKDEKPIAYMKEGGYTYGLLLQADQAAKDYHVKAYPTYFVIGKGGEVVYSAAGYDEKTFPAIRTAVEAALAGRPMPHAEPEAGEAPKAPDAKPDAGKPEPGKSGPNKEGKPPTKKDAGR